MNNEEHINWKMKGDEVKEMSNNTLFAILAALLAFLILGSVMTGTSHMEKVQKNFVDAGYEQVTLPGAMGYYWQKAE